MVDSVSVFFSYSHEDEPLRDALEVHMAPLRRGKLISSWHDRKIGAGAHWDKAIDDQMQAADIIVLLLSPHFFASDYCHDVEIPAALARETSGEAVVIPVILRPFNWYEQPLRHLQSVPRDKKAITLWDNLDVAYQVVVSAIRDEATRLLELRRQQALQREAAHHRYRTKFLEAFADLRISTPERETLDELRDKLGISAADAQAIEAAAEAPIKQYNEDLERYRKTLRKVIDEEYPISPQMREDLKYRRRDLGLKDEDADLVEAPILAEAEARHQARLAAPPPAAAPVPPAAPVPSPVPVPVPAPAPAPAAVQAPVQAPRPPEPASTPSVAAAPAPAPAAAAPRPPGKDVADLVMSALLDSGLGASTNDLFVGADIPDGKLQNAWRTCRVPRGEIVQGLIDLTIFGSAKDALVFGAKGLYYHSDGGAPKDHRLLWARWAHRAGAGFQTLADVAGVVVTPDGVSLFMTCDVKAADVAALLNDIHQRVMADAAADAAGEAGSDLATPAVRPTVPGPVIGAPTGADAQDQEVWRHLLADMLADLNEAVGRLLHDRSVGTDLRVFALAGDARADLLIVFVSESGELLVAVWGNKELPSALSLAHAARKRLSDEFGFDVLTGQGLAFARSFGPAGDADVEAVASLVRDLVFVVFDLPRGGLAVSWELAGG